LNVGCADPKYLRTGSNSGTEKADSVSKAESVSKVESLSKADSVSKVDSVLKVGPVLDARTKKKDFGRSLTDVYSELFKCFYDISIERQDSSAVVTSDIRKSVGAELQFQLLSCNIGQPICLTTECQNSDSSFVLYNYARISQIIRTFEKVK
jgi:hypothetical protein